MINFNFKLWQNLSIFQVSFILNSVKQPHRHTTFIVRKMNVNRERHPNGKMEDISYAVPLPYALHRIANALAAEESANIHELADNLKKYLDDFLESVKQIVKIYKS